MEASALQLKITLKHSKPPIWRRVLVHSEISFHELHYTIQMAMGWGAYHLYEFEFDKFRIGLLDEETEGYKFSDLIDSKEMTVGDILDRGAKKINYTYDFGDNWQHSIEIEKVLPLDMDTYYPTCLAGRMNCPPEDVGGIPGFAYFLHVMEKKKGAEYREMKHWAGGSYDPNEFDVEETNMYLAEIEDFMEDMENGDEDFF